MLDQAHKLRELALIDRQKRLGDSTRRARRIAVTSGKGGVGKSNFALNLAILSSALRKRTLLIDADTNLANIDILLGVSPKYNLSHVLAGQKTCREILIKGPGDISILPASSGSIEQALDEGVASDSIIYDLNSLDQDYDIIIFDTGAGIARTVLDFILISDTVAIVTTPEPTAVTDAYAMVKLVTVDRPDMDIQIMVNMASSKQEAMDVFDKLSSVIMHFLNTEVRFLGYLPRDVSVERAVHLQTPLVNSFPKSAAATQLKFIARKLLQPGYEPPVKPLGFLGSLFGRIKGK
jgi:flagellar biosynthesis protein FlhG